MLYLDVLFGASEVDGGGTVQCYPQFLWQFMAHLSLSTSVMPHGWLCRLWNGHVQWWIVVFEYTCMTMIQHLVYDNC